MANPYMELIQAQWEHISALYNEFSDKRPIILLDVDAGELHAYSFEKIKDIFDSGSQATLEEQYRRAVATRQMVLIVRDKENKQTLTYTIKLEDE
jgi:hypothetical protein